MTIATANRLYPGKPSETDLLYDVVILGAGIAGMASAIALKRAGVRRVLLTGMRNTNGLAVGECLPPDVIIPLAKLGLWDGFLAQKHLPSPGSTSIWGKNEQSYNDFLFNAHGHGWHVDRARFETWLLNHVSEIDVDFLPQFRFRRASRLTGGFYNLFLEQRPQVYRECKTRFIIDATGPRSAFARSQGLVRHIHDQLINVSVLFENVNPKRFDSLARLEAVENGWWYGASIPGGRAVLSFSIDPLETKSLGVTKFEGWARQLVKTSLVSRGLEGAVCRADSLTVISAFSSRIDRMFGENWIALGDAASCFDPISAQGIMKALTEVVSYTPEIVSYLSGGPARLSSLQERQTAGFAAYSQNRNYFYELEQRWPDSFFWMRRRAASKFHEVKKN